MKTSQIASLFNAFLVATKENNTKEFNALYPRVNTYLVRFVMQRSSNLPIFDAEEISNDAILKAINAVNTFDSERSQFSTFVAQIAKNELLNRKSDKAKVNKMKTVTIEGEDKEEKNTTFERYTGYSDSKIENVEVKSTKDILFDKYYRHLNANQIKIVKMNIKGYTLQEISEKLGMPLSTVKVTMLRAKNKLEEITGIEVKRSTQYKKSKALV